MIATAFCNVHRAPPCTAVHLYIARGTQAQKGLAASQWYLVSPQQILPTEGITSHLKGMFNAVIDFPGKKMQSTSSKNIKRSHSAVVKARTRSSAYFYFCLSFFCWCEKIDCVPFVASYLISQGPAIHASRPKDLAGQMCLDELFLSI